ncbi:MAG TPA: hypothetical protein VI233_01395 [Puia sp.]
MNKTIAFFLFAILLCPCRPAFSQAILFGEGIISTGDYETHPAFSPTGDTLYFLKGLPDANFFSILYRTARHRKASRCDPTGTSGR